MYTVKIKHHGTLQLENGGTLYSRRSPTDDRNRSEVLKELLSNMSQYYCTGL